MKQEKEQLILASEIENGFLTMKNGDHQVFGAIVLTDDQKTDVHKTLKKITLQRNILFVLAVLFLIGSLV